MKESSHLTVIINLFKFIKILTVHIRSTHGYNLNIILRNSRLS